MALKIFGDSASAWRELSLFESRDYCFRWYKKRHDRQLNAARLRAITSNFVQAREYFASAKASAPSVKPLLLYYGALSLSRGSILLRDKHKNEESLKPSHGLEAHRWGATLSKGIENILEIGVRATSGTFSELALAVGNMQSTAWWQTPNLAEGFYKVDYPQPNFLTDGSVITLDDLLSRDEHYLSIYPRLTGRTSRTYLGEVIADPPIGIDVALYSGMATKDDATSMICWPGGVQVVEQPRGRRLPIPSYGVHIAGTDLNALKPLLPVTQFLGNDAMFILADLKNGDRMSDFLRLFLVSYFLGMLVRYFPSKWISLLRNDKGDMAQPLLLAAMDHVEEAIPSMMTANLGWYG